MTLPNIDGNDDVGLEVIERSQSFEQNFKRPEDTENQIASGEPTVESGSGTPQVPEQSEEGGDKDATDRETR